MQTETTKRWNELDYYKEGQTIYGRDEEIFLISNGVTKNIQTIIYGQSGVGKSSLLFAGVFPKLRKSNFFPVFIRLAGINPQDYISVIKERVLEEANAEYIDFGKPSLNCITVDTETNNQDGLWYFFHTTEFSDYQKSVFIPVLVFDQFEEILNDKRTYDAAKKLLLELYTLVDNNRIIPSNYIQYSNYRVVFSLREDYLYSLEELVDKFNLSELRYNRYRIKWLNEHNAKNVIIKTFDKTLKSEDADEICNAIIERATNESGDISTIYLSLICSLLDIKCAGDTLKSIDLKSMDESIYRYYVQKMEVVSYKAKKYLEQHLVTPDGRRNSVDYNEAVKSGQITTEELNLLISNKLLRKVSLTGNSRVEYIHDIIPALVAKKNHGFFYNVKKTFQERHNIAGTASKSEYWMSAIVCIIMLYLSSVLGAAIYVAANEFRTLLIIVNGVWFFYFVKILLSLCIRRAHDVGLSGWKILSFKLNEESAVFPYTPKTSYYYTQIPTLIGQLTGRYTKQSEFMKLGINKYEFIASLVKTLKRVCVPSILIFAAIVDNGNLYISWVVGILGLYLILIWSSQFIISAVKRLNYLNINIYYSLIPFYNLYLFVRCFKNDSQDTPIYWTTKRGYVFFVTLILYIILILPVLIWSSLIPLRAF